MTPKTRFIFLDMKIRPAIQEDIFPIARLGRRFFDESSYSALMPYDETDARCAGMSILERGVGMVVEDDNGIQGFAGGLPVAMWFNRSHFVMNCLAIWLAPEHAGSMAGVKLIRAFAEESNKAGFNQVMFSDLEGVRSGTVARLLSRMGMRRVETSWIFEV